MPRPHLLTQLLQFEGVRLVVYHDPVSGAHTIGAGRNLDATGITREEAVELLRHDIARCTRDVARAFAWFERLAPVRQDILIHMAFNLGLGGLRTFRHFLAALEQGQFEEAAAQMLESQWAQQVGHRAQVLAQQMRTGVYAS